MLLEEILHHLECIIKPYYLKMDGPFLLGSGLFSGANC